MIRNVTSFFANVPTPAYYLDGLAPPNVDKAVKIMSAATLAKNLSCIMCSFREKFASGPDGHPAFPTNPNDSPSWFPPLLKDFVNKWTYNKENFWNKNPNLTFGNTKCRPIYAVNERTETNEVLGEKYAWQQDFVSKKNHWENPEDGANLKSIIGKAFSKASPDHAGSYMMIALVLNSFNRCCRGGEPRHDRHSESYWDSYHQCLVTWKHMIKTLAVPVCSPMVMHEKHHELCPLFAQANYYFLDGGLRRTRQQMDDHLGDSVFPDQRATTSNECCRKIGGFLKANLPKNATKELKEATTQKSLRSGAISTMVTHEMATFWTVINRTGHSSGTNVDSYIDRNSVTAGLPGAKILSMHTHFHRPLKVPSPHYLATDGNKWRESFFRLLAQALAGNCVPEFDPDGKLYHYAQHLLCLQLYYYSEIVDTHGINFAWVIGMKDMARRAQVEDPENPNKDVHTILYEWSLRIRDCHERNNDLMNLKMAGADLPSCGHMSKQVQVLLQDVVERSQSLEARLESSERKNHEHRKYMEELFKQMGSNFADLEKNVLHYKANSACGNEERYLAEIDRLKRKAASLASPSRQVRQLSYGKEDISDLRTPSIKKQKTSETDSDGSPIVVMSKEEMEAEQKQSAASFHNNIGSVASLVNYQQSIESFSGNVQVNGDVCLVAPNPGNRSFNQGKAKEHQYMVLPGKLMEEKKPVHLLTGRSQRHCHKETGTITMAQLMRDLRGNRKGASWFEGNAPWHDGSRPYPGSCSQVKMNFRRAMEVLEFALSAEAKKFLKSTPGKDHPTASESEYYNDLATQMMRTLLELENKDPDVVEAVSKKQCGINHKSSVNAVGSRVREVKNYIREAKGLPRHTGKKSYDDTPLEIGVEAIAPGTPKGNTSIRQHFGKNK